MRSLLDPEAVFNRHSLADELSGRRNALNFVRLCLAVIVIVGHCWPIGGFGGEARFGEVTIGRASVYGFFAISGYLIAGSRMRLNLVEFLWRRMLRILPAFWACLAVVGFLIAPITASLHGERYSPRSAIGYFASNSLLWIQQYGIKATLRDVPFPNAWNGSLWTLFYEFLCYLGAGVLLSAAWVRRYRSTVLVTLLVSLLVAYGTGRHLDITVDLIMNLMNLGVFFLAGMLFEALSPNIRLSPFVAAASIVGLGVAATTESVWLLAPIPATYLLLWLGARLPVKICRETDLSYGMYVFAFPIQQVLVVSGLQAYGFIPFAVASIGLTIPMAAISWNLVEQPTLRLKDRRPRRIAALSRLRSMRSDA